MNLPEGDEEYLNSKKFAWELIPNGDDGFLIIKNYRINDAKFDRNSADLMLRIPARYNLAKLDMWYTDPAVRVKASGVYPHKADSFEMHVGRKWQRFSRHLPNWRAGVDGLPMFLTFVNQELH